MRYPSFKNYTKTSTHRSKESYQDEFQVFPKWSGQHFTMKPFNFRITYKHNHCVFLTVQELILVVQLLQSLNTLNQFTLNKGLYNFKYMNMNSTDYRCLMEVNEVWTCTILLLGIVVFFNQHTVRKTSLYTNTKSQLGICDCAHCIKWSPTGGTLLWSENSLALNTPPYSCNTSRWHCFLMHMRGHLVGSLTEAHL